MESALTNVLFNEIRLSRRILTLRQDLSCSYDFTNYAAFRTLDKFNDGYITLDSLKHFYRSNYKYLSDKEALAIIRRVDTDGDARIGYSEFCDFLNNQIV